MAIRAIIGFEHLPQNVANWGNFATHGLTRGADSSQLSHIVNGWIVDKDTGGSGCRYTIPLAPYMTAPVNKIWGGFRIRLNQNPNPAAGIVYLNGTYILIISQIPGYAIGGVYHFEFSYVIATGVVERWINGVQLANASSPGTGQRTMTLGLEGKGSVAAMIDWRDIVITDDQGQTQGLPIGPLGPREVVPITLDAAAGGWVTTPAATPLLGAVGDAGADPTAKTAVSDINTKGPLTVSLKATIPAGKSVTAIELTASVQSAGSVTNTNASKLKLASVEQVGNYFQAPASWNHAASLGLFHKAPGNVTWTNATIDATDVIITPDV